MLIPRTAALLGALAFAPTLLAQTAPNPQTPAPFFVESIDFGFGGDFLADDEDEIAQMQEIVELIRR